MSVNANEKLRPGSGSASNIITERYLIEYRKNYPFSEFPPFVRKKWNNVIQVEIKHPKQIDKFFIPCFYCKKSLTLIYMRYNINIGTKLYCPECGNLIPVPEFKKYFNSRLIALDTSTIISRIVSKDLHSTRILQGNKFLLPTFVYEELDTKGPNLKKGGQKEILELKEMKMKGIIEFEDVDTHLLAHGLSNDRKILSVLVNQNAVLLTKDKTMTSFGKVNHFVLSIEGL